MSHFKLWRLKEPATSGLECCLCMLFSIGSKFDFLLSINREKMKYLLRLQDNHTRGI